MVGVGFVLVAVIDAPASAVPLIASGVALLLSVYVPDGAPGATVSLVKVVERAVETFPARSVEIAVIVTAPSPRLVTPRPVTETVPAPAEPEVVAGALLAPLVKVTRTVSVVREPAGSVTETPRLEAFAALMYAP